MNRAWIGLVPLLLVALAGPALAEMGNAPAPTAPPAVVLDTLTICASGWQRSPNGNESCGGIYIAV